MGVRGNYFAPHFWPHSDGVLISRVPGVVTKKSDRERLMYLGHR